jgi:LPS-assembly lipoprotein
MSLSKFGTCATRRGLVCALALGLSFGLTGCLRPLYGDATQSVTGGSVKNALSAIEVMPIPELMGHYLRNELVFDLDGSGVESPKRYRLTVSVTENLDVTVTDYSTGRADSATLVATATYTLREKDSDKVLFTASSVARATYDRSAQRFANLRAARDAQIRAAKSLSGLIRNRLAAGFAGGF